MNKKELSEAIEKVRPGVSCNTNVFEQSDSIYFGEHFIASYNGEIAVYVPFDAEIEGWVKAEEFQKLIQKMKTEDIELTSDGEKIQIKGGKTIISFNHVSEDITVPNLGLEEIKRWKALPEDFCEAVAFCRFSAANDPSRGVLNFIHVVENIVESCDNFRATRYWIGNKLNDELLISRDAAGHFSLYSPTHYQLSNGWIHFCNKKTRVVYSIRTLEESYNDLDKINLFEAKGVSFEFPEDTKNSLVLVEVLADKNALNGKVIKITVSKGKMKFKGENEIGIVEDELKIKHSGTGFSFDIVSEHLTTILTSLTGCILADGKIFFEGENFQHVMALIKK